MHNDDDDDNNIRSNNAIIRVAPLTRSIVPANGMDAIDLMRQRESDMGSPYRTISQFDNELISTI